MAIKYLPLNELSLCFTCAGCNRLSDPNFVGVVKCDEGFRFAYPEYYRRMNIEYGAEIENKKKEK
jgi:hypothetical protein